MSTAMGNVVELRPAQKKKPPTLPELVARVRALSKDSWNVLFDTRIKSVMTHRGKTMRDVLETLTKGEGVKGPEVIGNVAYQIKLRRCVCGNERKLLLRSETANCR